MASINFDEKMKSSSPKEIFLKFELLEYDETTERFELIDNAIVKERKLPNGMSNINGGIDKNLEQDIRSTLNIEITNADGINNWGADFDSGNNGEFKWWLDKRLNVDLGLRTDAGKIEFVRMGHFIITHFRTNHNLTSYPVTQIQGSSKEVLYASRRGKFLYPTAVQRNSVMTDTIRHWLTKAGEEESKIMIDPEINKTSIKLDDGENLYGWTAAYPNVDIGLDTVDKAHGESSIKIDINTSDELAWTVVAEKTFDFPVDMRRINSIAMWTRSSRHVPEGGISLVLIDESGETRDLPLREMVGHVIKDGQVVYIDNWRNIVLGVDKFNALAKVIKMQIKVNSPDIYIPFTLWLDQIYCAEIRNMLPHDLNYGAGDNTWSAIKELANLLDCSVHYDDYGNFKLMKRKFPKEKKDGEDFKYDAYSPLEPVIEYNDTDVMNNLYAGTENLFEEHELSNHIQVTGGSTNTTVMTLVDMALYNDGLHVREKGKVVNSRGKVRAIDQFYAGSEPTVFNGNSNVEEIYKGHQNLEDVVAEYPNGFPELEQPPITNFAIERIGDFIYHHNNANPDPIIVYAYEGKNRALWELRKRLAYAEQLNLLSAPFYTLKCEDIIRVTDSLLGLDDNFQIKSMNIPLNGDYISISTTKIRNFMIDIPYFDLSSQTHNACWYGYDGLGLCFTFPLTRKTTSFDDEDEESNGGDGANG